MRIRLKLMGMLKDKLPEGGEIELPDGATIADLLRHLEIPGESVQVFTVNGTLERDPQRPLNDQDELAVIPPVGGG